MPTKFICKKCEGEIKDGRLLCGLSFCVSCNSCSMLTCKGCSQCRVEYSSISTPLNFAILPLMKKFPKHFHIREKEDSSMKKVVCQNCETREGKIFCENCKIHLCVDCSSTIHTMKAFQAHTFTDNRIEKTSSPQSESCNIHSKKKEFYCERCDEVLCSVCLVDEHNLHSPMSVQKYVEIYKNKMKNSIQQIISSLPNLTQLGESYQDKASSLDTQISDLELQIELLKQKREKVQLKIQQNQREQELFAEINLFIEKFIDEISLCDFQSHNCQLLGDFQENINHIYRSILPTYGKHLKQKEKERPELSTGFNNLDYLSKLYVSIHGSRGIKPGNFCDPYFLSTSVDANLVAVSDYYNRRIQMFNLKGDFLYQFGSKGTNDGQFNGPMGIAICAKLKQIIVCDHANHRIQMFDLNGNFLNCFGEKGTEAGQFQFPSGIAISKRANRIVVADFGNHRVQVFDLQGTFKFEISKNNSNYHHIDDSEFSPMDVDISNKGNLIVVSDFKNHRIKCFDLKGNFKSSFGSFGDKNGEFNCPSGVAISMKANLIAVSDEFNHRISLYDLTNFTFKCHFYSGKVPFEQLSSRPRRDGENGKHRNSVYRKLSNGNLPDEFRFPRGIDINAKANVITLSDRGNNRFLFLKSFDYNEQNI